MPQHLSPATNDQKIESPKTQWGAILIALSIGVVVAGYAGKTPPAIPGMRTELHLSLVMAGWVVSIFSALGCISGIFVGVIADRIGRARMVVIALLILATGSLLGSVANSAAILLLSRAIEGAGYIGAMAIVPALITRLSSDQHRGLAVSLWSCVTPLGMAIAMVAAPTIIEPVGWRGLWIAIAVLTLIFVVISFLTFKGIDAKTQKNTSSYWSNIAATLKIPGPWLISLCFMSYTLQWMAIIVWLPTFVVEQRGGTLALAATLAAFGVIASILGNLFGAWLVHRGMARWLMITIGSATMGLSAVFIFPDILPDTIRFVLVLIFSFVGALQPTSLIAGVPRHSPTESQLGATNGLLYQGSQAGQLLGPPIVALIVTHLDGWQHAGWILCVATLANIVMAQYLRSIEKPVLK